VGAEEQARGRVETATAAADDARCSEVGAAGRRSPTHSGMQ
jgi:hypothetical protein